MLAFLSRAPRALEIAIGVYLIAVAIVRPDVPTQRINAMVVGMFVVTVATAALRSPRLRFLNTAAAPWLFASALSLPTQASATVADNLRLGPLLFVLALVPSAPLRRPAATPGTLPDRGSPASPARRG